MLTGREQNEEGKASQLEDRIQQLLIDRDRIRPW